MSNIITVNIIYVVKSVLSQGAPLARAYLGFYCKKRLEVSLLLQDGMLIHRKATPPAPSIASGIPDNLPLPIYTPGCIKVLPKNTTQYHH